MVAMDEVMSYEEPQRYLRAANDELQAAHDNMQLGHARVAVSRAYYAMFYTSTALLGSRGYGVANIRELLPHSVSILSSQDLLNQPMAVC